MSPGGTMMRVYANLKRRIMDGDFGPGSRLDPARLKDDLVASQTPIRDALHRLTGEGLVESLPNEGFRMPHVSEPALRDHYEWTWTLVRLSLDAGSARPDAASIRPQGLLAYPDRVTILLTHVAGFSLNHELRRAMAILCDHGFALRTIERDLLHDASAELDMIEQAIAEGKWDAAHDSFRRFHDRRQAIVPQIAHRLRDRSGGQTII